MFRKVFFIAGIGLSLAVAACARQVKPYLYWTFEKPTTGQDEIKDQSIDTNYYQCNYSIVKSISGNGVDLSNSNCLVVTNALKNKIKNQLSVELLFKGKSLSFMTFGLQYFYIRFYYAAILFRTSFVKNGKVVSEDFIIQLNGAGKKSYNYYTDGAWHHLVFTASSITGKKEIWVDGELVAGFSTTISKNMPFAFGNSDGFRYTDQIDELAFYNTVIPPALIAQHAAEVHYNSHYAFKLKPTGNKMTARMQAVEKDSFDYLEFAPGYPDYNVQPLDQLQAFPLPRYKTGVKMNRLISWMDITYLHRELPQAGGKGFGKTNSQRAVQLSKVMADYWNYYIDLPVLRTTAAAAEKEYANKNTVSGALVKFVKNNPQYPYSTTLFQVQSRPVHAGFERKTAYITAKDLPDRYYMRDARGRPITYKGTKYLSPLMPLDIVQNDGTTSRFYLDQLFRHVRRVPAVISENGEYFGHIRPIELLEKDPRVLSNFKRSGLSVEGYSGRFQYRLDSTYRATVMKGLDTNTTYFSFYNVSALRPEYWPAYEQRRKLNRSNRDIIYSTPDFYPRFPYNWYSARGAYNGFGPIAAGRVTEMKLGDRFFSPFISAGWGPEEDNVRPAQWLALLKAMIMLGADFFYVGYFNVTGRGGKWPNGVGPNDPRGYAYQIAMPPYAQAIGSYVREFITKGILLNPAEPTDKWHQFRFNGKAENELILVRKLGKKFLIYGSIQPNSNTKGNVPDETITEISLEGKRVSFPIRRQGSIYILDLSKGDPVFYQLDGWHEYKHPWYWSKNIEMEAELPDNDVYSDNIHSECRYDNKFDFTNNTAWLSFGSQLDSPRYIFKQRKPFIYYCYIRARAKNGKEALLQIQVQGRENRTGSIVIKGSAWKWYQVKNDSAGNALQFSSSDDSPVKLMPKLMSEHAPADVDKMIISTDSRLSSE